MSDSISVRVLFFAQAREQTKLSEGTVVFLTSSYQAKKILENIIDHYPSLKPLEHCVILARNQCYLELESEEPIILNSNDELAVIPPISAASSVMDIINLTPEKIDVDGLISSVTSSKCGAVSLFIGTTRDNFECKKVIRLEYEAYEPMAIAEIKKICTDLRQKWNLEHIGIIHRLGLVPVKEASIVVAISSEHRKESLDAVHYAIDALKAAVPIWKKEVYEADGADSNTTTAWKANQECSWKKKEDAESADVMKI